MFDLGDLREGIYYTDKYLDTIEVILKLSNIELIGIGTNLTCYGGVIPTYETLVNLVNIKEEIENHFNIKLDIISGGNSSSLPLLLNNELPKEINNLRLGEVIMLGRETAYGNIVQGLFDDVFILQAQVIELKEKPSYPIGKLGMDSFGQTPNIIDKGIMRRAILNIGKQDIILDNLTPIDNIEIIGGSSDHLICDFKKTNYNLGDVINFKINYPGLLQLMTSKYVKKKIY
jgi:predicted amino acid racemase